MEFDYEQLNEAAQSVYDVAFSAGREQGVEETADRLGRSAARNMLEVADRLLNGDQYTTDREIALAITALRKVPLMAHDKTYAAIDALRSARPPISQPGKTEAVHRARSAIAAALKDLA